MILGQRQVTQENKKIIEDTAQACYNYMLTTEAKERVLNPQGRKPIAKIDWQPNIYTEKSKKESECTSQNTCNPKMFCKSSEK